MIGKSLDGISAWVERNHQLAGSLDDVAGAFAAIKVAPWVLWALKRVLPGAGATAAVAVAALHGDTGPVTARQRWQADYNDLPNGPSIRSMNAPNGSAPALPTSAARRRTMEQTRAFWMRHGYTAAQTAGILTAPSAESGFDPMAKGDYVNGRPTSHGMYQIHGQRYRMEQQWMARHHGDINDPLWQNRFALWELTKGDQTEAGRAVKRQTTGRGAGYVFNRDFERPRGGDTTAAIRASSAHLFMPPAQAPQIHTVKGAATVHINLAGATPGTRVSAHSDGDLFAGAPRVTMPMPAGGVP